MHKQYQGRNLRKGRTSIPNQVYLITTITKNRTPIFQDFYAARILVGALRFQTQQQQCQTLAFVIMPDHLHWLLALESTQDLPYIVKAVKQFSAKQINRRNSSTGTALWQKGFHDHALRKEENIQATARYIVANPLRAGLVTKIGDYPHWDAIWLL
ncbi:Transposase and inactivated derivatives [hydrothermal vent metagenome]|uniref:Transposase and inactivated derivatives n=1 Tax=hydrothermal vent metagenome TaxID=652676 RepID=A0A3B1AQP8_9ZZZZ